MKFALRVFLAVCVLAAMAFAGITVSSPANGATVTSPVHIVASASSSYPITGMHVYVDSNDVFSTGSNKIDTYLALATGNRYVVIQAWDSTGAIFKSALTINVSGTSNGVTVSSPSNGASVGSPVHFVASAKSSAPITAMRIYADGNSVYSTGASSLDTYVSLGGGQHYIVVQAWDSNGALLKAAPMTINVGSASTGGSTTIPSTAKVYSNIDQMGGWQSCTECAGIGASGPVAKYSMSQGISNPSMDGGSAEFWIGGTTPYADALWWKQLGANASAHHFVYDLYFYLKTPQYAQALEFDVNQSVGGKKYIFGTQCDIRHDGQWEVWDGKAVAWRGTGVSCTPPSPYTWHHLVEEFVRDDSGNVTFVSITLDGNKHYINRKYGSISSGASEINVAFQMDGDYAQHDFSTWVDKIKLSYW